MILIDKFGHMVSNQSIDDLHIFARRIGLKRDKFIHGRLPRYNCVDKTTIREAQIMGARLHSTRDIVIVIKKQMNHDNIDIHGVKLYR